MKRLFATALLVSLFTFAASAQQQAAAPTPARMEVVLLGTGFPRPSNERAGPSTAVLVGKKAFIVDAGRGITMRLDGAKIPLAQIQAVFLTHLHSDHIDGLPDLYHSPWVLGRETSFQLYGPEGTREIADAMKKFYAEDIRIRGTRTEMHPLAGAGIEVHIVQEGIVYQDDELKITAFPVDHRPVEPAFGYKFESGGRAIVISGDTRPSDNLIRYAKGADVLVHEAYLTEYFTGVDSPAVAARLRAYHTTAEQAGDVATAARVKLLVLTHLIPGDNDPEFLRRASQHFKGKIAVGHDLDRF
ncbi:MAG TPA: MBL fold metallo-hydrolase [Candidatus Acidoferrales bacterium]|nr:MBL fold metallo-hydrolase [Candidatus Acidoferrales bacterium]